ncbi:hypothetical protein BEN49_08000 [Hymenobacter coccineus]|uniref:Uncharacterized protein n=1 Tax=Hymenobacter coccineus TaxID=1908235 RepID=A0A1G1TGF2_9BACT|nr:hypothetical protein BEN49_08000 [Hymenobacter coccineus]
MAALDAALALEEVHNVAVLVAEYLDFDVARRADVLLDEHRPVAERRRGLRHRQLHLLHKFGRVVHHAHALAAATSRSLDEDREADLFGNGLGGGHVGNGLLGARHQRNVKIGHRSLGGQLAAHQLHGLGRGPHENEARRAHGAGKAGVFAQEAVAGVDGVDA